jgi:hypothetical protein
MSSDTIKLIYDLRRALIDSFLSITNGILQPNFYLGSNTRLEQENKKY